MASIVLGILLSVCLATRAQGAWRASPHKPVPAGAIAMDRAQPCDKPGATYVLTRDIACDASGLFLAKGVTLDLNGYTLTYAAAKYQHVPNYGFEQGLAHWDVTKARGAEILSARKVKPFVGEKICRLPAGSEIVSEYVTLPLADRSYYAMCGVLSHKMRVTVSVEDAAGRPVKCAFRFGRNIRVSCPQTGHPKLGGGFVFAHLHHLPAGKYRVRLRAETDCLIDHVDIRPALDVGLGIVEKTYPWAYYRCIADGDYTAFFDQTRAGTLSEPVASVPRVTGEGTVTIRNGVIRNGFRGVRSWGVQSTAKGVRVVIENVKVVASGINTHAVDVPHATIRNCRFELDTPQIIDRHRIYDCAVALREAGDSLVADSEFLGGQGCLTLMGGRGARVTGNLLAGRQTVTNHYSLALTASRRCVIEGNRFEPQIGSGILVFRAADNEIARNTFRIVAANANCEYTNADYSTNAIRLTDYNAPAGSPKGAAGNRVHHNTFHITGRHYTDYANYRAVATAVFYSVGAGPNTISDNDITVRHEAPHARAIACAFYIGAANSAGVWADNRITTNVPAFWLACFYGEARGAVIRGNTITKAAGAAKDYQPFRFGWWKYEARDVRFECNRLVGSPFGIAMTNTKGNHHTYSLWWKLTVRATDADGKPAAGRDVTLTDANGREAFRGKTDAKGQVQAVLPQWRAEGERKTPLAPYTVTCGPATRKVDLTGDQEALLRLGS